MVTAEERVRILQMLQEGRISSEAAAQLLDALGSSDPVQIPMADRVETINSSPDPRPNPRWLRVRVTDTDSGRPKVNVRLPISLVSMGLKIGSHYAPEIQGLDVQALIEAAQTGDSGAFVDVYDEDDGEHVEVFLE